MDGMRIPLHTKTKRLTVQAGTGRPPASRSEGDYDILHNEPFLRTVIKLLLAHYVK
jgi:hypothetical protein